MATITAIANTKGGTGKTTVAANLATVAAHGGHPTLLVDADPQGSALSFLSVRDEARPTIEGLELTRPTLHKQLPRISEAFDYVFIDVGGRDAPVLRSALVAADVILIPIAPTAFDAWAADDIFTLVDEVAARGDIEALVVLNLVTNTIAAREAAEGLEVYLEGHSVRLLKSRLHTRTAWPRASGEGLGVLEWRRSSPATRELLELTTELGITA